MHTNIHTCMHAYIHTYIGVILNHIFFVSMDKPCNCLLLLINQSCVIIVCSARRALGANLEQTGKDKEKKYSWKGFHFIADLVVVEHFVSC